MPQKWKVESRKLWLEVRRLSEIRNMIAHSPIVIGWRGQAEGPPDVVGIPKLKYLKLKHGSQVPHTPLAQVLKAGGELVPVAEGVAARLEELRKKADRRSKKSKPQ